MLKQGSVSVPQRKLHPTVKPSKEDLRAYLAAWYPDLTDPVRYKLFRHPGDSLTETHLAVLDAVRLLCFLNTQAPTAPQVAELLPQRHHSYTDSHLYHLVKTGWLERRYPRYRRARLTCYRDGWVFKPPRPKFPKPPTYHLAQQALMPPKRR